GVIAVVQRHELHRGPGGARRGVGGRGGGFVFLQVAEAVAIGVGARGVAEVAEVLHLPGVGQAVAVGVAGVRGAVVRGGAVGEFGGVVLAVAVGIGGGGVGETSEVGPLPVVGETVGVSVGGGGRGVGGVAA